MTSRYSDSGAQMTIYSLNRDEVAYLISALQESKYEVLVGSDPTDSAFKVKIDGHTWSIPMGREKD